MPDRDRDTLQVLHHVDGVKPKRRETCAGENCVTNGIVLGLKVCAVLASVDFDHQATY